LQIAFLCFFSMDLSLRWAADGAIVFFQTREKGWNIFDLCVVLFGFLDLTVSLFLQDTNGIPNASVLRVLRIVRIMRVAKVFRVMRFFQELRMMVYSILSAWKSLMWIVLVLWITFYIFGIVFTVAALEKITGDSWADPKYDQLQAMFGTLSLSTLHLFMAMSGGADWNELYWALETTDSVFCPILFIVFLTFSIFVVSNIVTGVMVETAFQTNKKDHALVVSEELEAKKTYLASLQRVFNELDKDETGCISQQEFEERLSEERVIAYFNAMKLDVSDARTLYQMLDTDGSQMISIDEFLDGCVKLQGESRALDVKIMQYEVRHVREAVASILACLNSQHSHGSILKT